MNIKVFLDSKYHQFNQLDFIPNDPISIPKQFSTKEDIEIIGFLVALISWGQRVSILKSGNRLAELFHHAPLDFILNHSDKDLIQCQKFVHRTFNGDDLLAFIAFLKFIYLEQGGLENVFSQKISANDSDVGNGIEHLRHLYVNQENVLNRSLKHLACPSRGSACKRINMFLRWMVRKDENGVDFGIWKGIQTNQLVCPLDVHVINEANAIGLIQSQKSDWKTAIELTNQLKKYDSNDPVKYDFALFGSGEQKKKIKTLQKGF